MVFLALLAGGAMAFLFREKVSIKPIPSEN